MSRKSRRRTLRNLSLFALFLAASVFALVSCDRLPWVQKSPDRVHAISRELLRSGAQAAGSAAKSDSRLQYDRKHADRSDHLFFTLPAGGAPDAQRALLDRLTSSLLQTGDAHHLRHEITNSAGLVRLNFFAGDRLTQSIHIITPFVPRRAASPNSSKSTGAPRLAIILDDMGADPQAAAEVFALPYPLTVSVLPNHPHSTDVAEEAHRRGYQVMLHLPMESVGNEAAERVELHPGMNESAVSNALDEMLDTVPNAVGVNNHQGSRATASPELMSLLMPLLRERKLFYVDSRTTAATVAYDTAQQDAVPSAFRNVPFLDDVQDEAAIRKQLELAIRGAKEKGEAIAIGHPHPETIRALMSMLPEAEAQGVRLVHASELVH